MTSQQTRRWLSTSQLNALEMLRKIWKSLFNWKTIQWRKSCHNKRATFWRPQIPCIQYFKTAGDSFITKNSP